MSAEKWVQNSSGCMELIDTATGNVLERGTRRKTRRTVSTGRGPGRPSKQELAAIEAGEPVRRMRLYPYDPVLADLICNAVIDGERLSKLDDSFGFPVYAAIQMWRSQHPEFDRKIKMALECRAFRFEEMALAVAEEAHASGDKDLVPGARLAHDAYRRAAEWNDPARYGNKVTHEGNTAKPVVINVVTGFPPPNKHQIPPRIGPDGFIIKDDDAENK